MGMKHIVRTSISMSIWYFTNTSSAQAPTSRRSDSKPTNVKRRLDLIYGDRYTLDIKDKTDVYDVLLRLPIQKTENHD